MFRAMRLNNNPHAGNCRCNNCRKAGKHNTTKLRYQRHRDDTAPLYKAMLYRCAGRFYFPPASLFMSDYSEQTTMNMQRKKSSKMFRCNIVEISKRERKILW